MYNPTEAIHVHLEGFTAFFKHPLTITGTQISLPNPPYSTILGLISACAGKNVSHHDTRIGFEFRCASTDIELERTDRLVMDDRGYLKAQREGQGILRRYVNFRPQLDIYLTNTDLAFAFESPIYAPTLGRSQDLVWITCVEKVDLTPAQSGYIGPTLLRSSSLKGNVPSLIVRCPEWFDNNTVGITRLVGPIGFYQAILPTIGKRIKIAMDNNTLYHPSNLSNSEDVIYIHKWIDKED